MSLTIRQSLLFTLITGFLLLLFSAIIDYGASRTRLDAFYGVLEKEAVTKFNLVTQTSIDTQTLQTIYRKNRAVLNEVEVAVYSKNFELLYHDDIDIDFVKETPEMLRDIAQNRIIRFEQDDWQVVGMRLGEGDNYFLVTAAAYDAYGYGKLYRQRRNMTLSFVLMLVLLYFAGLYFARKTLRPLQDMLAEIKRIGASNLHRRIPTTGGRDELAQLANSFNNMLERLENAFAGQQSFVSNVAHELRTPLAGILADIDLALEKPRSEAYYQNVLRAAAEDARHLTRLTASLLDLAKAGFDSSAITFTRLRTDEIMLEALKEVQTEYPNTKMNVVFSDDIDLEKDLQLHGNAYLLKVALVNVLENACKYSSGNPVEVSLTASPAGGIYIHFDDRGPGISEDDQHGLFTPFYRGKQHRKMPGMGVGLSLSKRIVEQHGGRLFLNYTSSKGSRFTIELKAKS